MRREHYYCAWMITSIITVAISQETAAQSACPNSNFSNQDFSAWQGLTGDYFTPGQTPGIIPGRHTIFSAPAMDPNTCNGLNVIPPGETTSARIGNAATGAEAEQLIYSMPVTAQNALFVYKYAVVLEDAGHTPTEQPEFAVRLLDALGNPVGGACGAYTVYAGQPGQNFQTCGGVTWLPWTTVGIDLTPYIGQAINIEFTTKDCSLGGHFGYAYISANCSPLTLQLDYCAGDQTINLSAPNGFQNYLWMPDSVQGQNITVPTPAIGTVFTCTMTTFSNQGNCSVDVDVTIAPTVVTANFPTAVACMNTAMQLVDSSSVNNGALNGWSWDFGDGTSGTDPLTTHVYTTAGIFDVTLIATSDLGCSDTITQTVLVHALPTPQFLIDGVCSNDSVSFFNTSNGLNPLNYVWDFDDNSTSTVVSPMHNYPIPGNYSVELLVTDGNGCSDSLTLVTTQFAPPVVDAGPVQTICSNTVATLTATGAVTYQWNHGVQNAVPFIVTQPETYIVTGTDVNGCSATDSTSVSFFPTTQVLAGNDASICFGDSTLISASGVVNYQWTGGFANNSFVSTSVGILELIVTGTDANGCLSYDTMQITTFALPVVSGGPDQTICLQSEVTLQGAGAVSYSWNHGVVDQTPFQPQMNAAYIVIGTDINGCQNTDTVLVVFDVQPSFDASFSVNQGCAPLYVQFTLPNSTANYTWNFGDESSAIGTTVDHNYESDGCFDVSLHSVSPIGCVYDTVFSQVVCVFPNPVASFQPNPYFMSEFDPTTTMTNSSIGAVAYVWNFGDGSTTNYFQPSHTYENEPNSYEIILTAVSDRGCVDTAMATVVVEEELVYFVPNTFTPDGDGINEAFKPVIESGFDPKSYRFYIFNRWGQQIFESQEIEDGWDGTFQGVIAQDGTYTWKIEFRSVARGKVDNVVTGHVNLLR